MGTVNEQFPGATFLNGVAEPVLGKDVDRLYQAFGGPLVIEPFTEDDLQLVVDWLQGRGNNERADLLMGLATDPAPTVTVAPPVATTERYESDMAPEPRIAPEPPMIDRDVDGMEDVDALRATAEALGIAVDGRWKEQRLKAEIRKAREES